MFGLLISVVATLAALYLISPTIRADINEVVSKIKSVFEKKS